MDTGLARGGDNDLSPYRVFAESEWARLRADTALTLSQDEVKQLQSLGDPVPLSQVETIYLPLSRLLHYYVEAAHTLHSATRNFLGTGDAKTPFIMGIAGSVAVGKSTTARLLQRLMARWPGTPKVDLVTTDGFLYPNAMLEADGLMRRKGFPESYDTGRLVRFLSDLKSGARNISVPVYSHLVYDIVPDQVITVDQPDILILEGLNVLQTSPLPRDGKAVPFVSDFFDCSIYIDAEESVLRDWYLTRFMSLRQTAFRDPRSYFQKYVHTTDEEALRIADDLWTNINLVNLRDNILPTRPRADLILAKGSSHAIERVSLKRI